VSKISASLNEITKADSLSAGDSYLHRRHPLCVLLVTICYIIAVMLVDSLNLFRLIPFILLPLVAYQITGISLINCFYKLRYVLPFVCLVGIWNPFINKTPCMMIGNMMLSEGMVSFISLLLKGIFILMATYLLGASMGIEKICYALRLVKLPGALVQLLLMTFRYLSLIGTEADCMNEAYQMRAPGQKGIHKKAWGSFLGQLLLRSMDRSKEVYYSMQLRGFSGDYRYLRVQKPAASDFAFMIISITIIMLFGYFDVAVIIGNIITMK